MEPPECPVCLQPFDGSAAIPRVLGCGHSCCEECLKQLPHPFPSAVRCPACTQLVQLPPQGPSALPKNIDLLRLTEGAETRSADDRRDAPTPIRTSSPFLPRLWSDEFESAWKDWILRPRDYSVTVSCQPAEEEGMEGVLPGLITLTKPSSHSAGLGLTCRVKENQKVSLVRITRVSSANDTALRRSYFYQVMATLASMDEGMITELGLILKATFGTQGLSQVYGIWYDGMDDGILYMVCEQKFQTFVQKIDKLGISVVESSFSCNVAAALGVELCEALIGLHSEGIVLGCLGLGCLELDEFGHVYVDLGGVLAYGCMVAKVVADGVAGTRKINQMQMGNLYFSLLQKGIFVSPEVFIGLLQHEGVVLECEKSRFSVGHGSDVWSLACLLSRIILGDKVIENVAGCVNSTEPDGEERGLDFLNSLMGLTRKVRSLLQETFGTEHAKICQVICECLDLNPDSRPLKSDLWKCMKYSVATLLLDDMVCLEGPKGKEFTHCIALGKLCQLSNDTPKNHEVTKISEHDNESAAHHGSEIDKAIADGVSEGNFKVTVMKGHLDSITGLAVGGGFLLSSSYDKTINVWSLQDFSLVHTFRGHEQKVAALIYVEMENPLCISGDSGGGIFIWGITSPFRHEPLRKLHEEKDWRYSGIHALAVCGTEYFYTGSGDKSIKVWSLQDFSLSCTLTGHRSVVSSLAVSCRVLYSGSWDGTLRLWSTNDHSLLTILGEDMLGSGSVLSLSVFNDMLAVCQENGCIKIWKNDVFKKSRQVHNGAAFAVSLDDKWLFSGGWDKTIHVQELLDDGNQMDVRAAGCLSPESVVTALVYWQGKLFAGCADRQIKVWDVTKFVNGPSSTKVFH